MSLKDGRMICDNCGAKVPADSIPRGWIIISSGRLKEQCVKIHISYGPRENGEQSLLESYTRSVGSWCGVGCLEHFARQGSPRGFGSIAHMVNNHKRGRPTRTWTRIGKTLRLQREIS